MHFLGGTLIRYSDPITSCWTLFSCWCTQILVALFIHTNFLVGFRGFAMIKCPLSDMFFKLNITFFSGLKKWINFIHLLKLMFRQRTFSQQRQQLIAFIGWGVTDVPGSKRSLFPLGDGHQPNSVGVYRAPL